MTWKPSNQPTRYNHERVAQLEPIEQAIAALDLPLVRVRKLNPIFNALAMQIEDGGDNPEVNRLLMDALRAGIRHQVDDDAARLVLAAIDTFERTETDHWEQVRAGTFRGGIWQIQFLENVHVPCAKLIAHLLHALVNATLLMQTANALLSCLIWLNISDLSPANKRLRKYWLFAMPNWQRLQSRLNVVGKKVKGIVPRWRLFGDYMMSGNASNGGLLF